VSPKVTYKKKNPSMLKGKELKDFKSDKMNRRSSASTMHPTQKWKRKGLREKKRGKDMYTRK